MSSASSTALLVFISCSAAGRVHAAELRVCADPNNLPYSNIHEQGFENKLAQIVARDLGRTVKYVWSPQRGDYLRTSLLAGRCDMVMSVPSSLDEVQTTRSYYRSSYVFVSRRDRHLGIRSFDDPALRTARVGVHVLQHDDASVPPARALVDRGLIRNIAWYKLYPDFSRSNPPAALLEAVERGDIDLAIAWGPLAGYFARNASVPLDVIPVSPQFERSVPFVFSISMGVRPGDTKLLREINAVIARHRSEINRLLRQYGVPLLGNPELQTTAVR